MNRKKVAFFVSSLNGGGIENYLLRFLKYYKDEIDATVICKLGFTGDLYDEYICAGVKVETLKVGYYSPASWYKLYCYLRGSNFKSICDFTGNFAAIPLLLAKLANVKIRVAFYRGSTNRFKESWPRLIYNHLSKVLVEYSASSILSNSLAALNYFFPRRKRSVKKFQVVYNGIDSNQFCSEERNFREQLSIPKQAFVIGHVGRFDIAKNHDTIIKVALSLCSSNPSIYFVLCGKGVDENLKEKVLQAGLGSQIKLLGYRSDVSVVLNTLDAFYFPSITEGQPNALIEAMVMGLPFVASNIAPILETVPGSLHNQLVTSKDVDGAISKLLDIYHSQNRCEYTCANWAKDKYSADSCFSLFMGKLK